MRLIIQENSEGVASWVASYVTKRLNAFKPTPERPFVLGVYRPAIHDPPGRRGASHVGSDPPSPPVVWRVVTCIS
jgi:hypothetical protein